MHMRVVSRYAARMLLDLQLDMPYQSVMLLLQRHTIFELMTYTVLTSHLLIMACN